VPVQARTDRTLARHTHRARPHQQQPDGCAQARPRLCPGQAGAPHARHQRPTRSVSPLRSAPSPPPPATRFKLSGRSVTRSTRPRLPCKRMRTRASSSSLATSAARCRRRSGIAAIPGRPVTGRSRSRCRCAPLWACSTSRSVHKAATRGPPITTPPLWPTLERGSTDSATPVIASGLSTGVGTPTPARMTVRPQTPSVKSNKPNQHCCPTFSGPLESRAASVPPGRGCDRSRRAAHGRGGRRRAPGRSAGAQAGSAPSAQ
jgi:hypothetical protein